jgi:hypothetical protein
VRDTLHAENETVGGKHIVLLLRVTRSGDQISHVDGARAAGSAEQAGEHHPPEKGKEAHLEKRERGKKKKNKRQIY